MTVWRRHAERIQWVLLCAVAVVITALDIWQPDWAAITLLLIPLVLAGIVLGPAAMSWFVVIVMALSVLALSQQSEFGARTVNATAAVFAVGLIALLLSFRRARLGVATGQGESMFVDLRDRLLRQGVVPPLPEGWLVETALDSAGGTLFAGDFIVTAVTGTRIEVVVVDVSGKGVAAGTRALLLCGAFGGLLGSMAPEEFLPAANAFLLRQQWDEGFATAVHVSLDTESGAYEVRTAGHPPALLRRSGSWERLTSYGVFLGLLPAPAFDAATGILAEGESLMLYTDGVIEEEERDIDRGIDLLVARAETEVRRDLVGAAHRLVVDVGAEDDDRTLVLLHRL